MRGRLTNRGHGGHRKVHSHNILGKAGRKGQVLAPCTIQASVMRVVCHPGRLPGESLHRVIAVNRGQVPEASRAAQAGAQPEQHMPGSHSLSSTCQALTA